MKIFSLRRPKGRRLAAGAIVAAALAGSVAAVQVASAGSAHPASHTAGLKGGASSGLVGRHLDMDHATFPSAGDLAGQSANIFLATVQSSKPGDDTSLGTDPATGAALPPLPHTDFTVRVDQVFKGGTSSGSSAVVTLAGGITDVGPVTMDGVPDLPIGSQFLFFLTPAQNGKYYPLAGGAAIANVAAPGQYTLPAEATGSAPLAFGPAQLKSAPQSVRLVITSHPPLGLNGAAQSGGVTLTQDTATSSTVAGDVLISGSVLHVSITLSRGSASGFISVDGTEFKLIKAVSLSQKNGVHILGSVSSGPSGHPQTAHMDLVISQTSPAP